MSGEAATASDQSEADIGERPAVHAVCSSWGGPVTCLTKWILRLNMIEY